MAESVELATILLTDLVGSTRLATSVGPVRADELREEHFDLLRDAIVASGGREVKNTGDGLMVAFSSASAAVECAIEMQQLFERRYRDAEQALHVRIGLGAGESTVKDGDYFGLPSIEAARLCGQAPADGILISGLGKTLAGRCEGIQFASAGELELKGFPEPVQAFSVSWAPLAEETGWSGRWPLPVLLRSVPPVAYVGRVSERAALEEASALARGGSRQVVLLSGEPGIGKTRLASFAAHRAHSEGSAVAWGACSEELAVPYEPWIGLCSQLVEHAPQELLAGHVERHKGELARLARNLEQRISGLPEPQVSDPETERYLLFSAVVGFLGEVANIVPLCLVLDDLHWADGQSVALLKHLVRTFDQDSLHVIATYRDSDLGTDHPLTAILADLRAMQGVQRIALHGLDTDEVAQIMTAVAGHELDADAVELAGQIAQETDGNPFFVGEILRGLSESGALVFDEASGRWSVDRTPGAALPESVREVVERRVERLGDKTLEVLTQAAVIGRTFDLDVLESMFDVDEGALLDQLEAAVAGSLLGESTERVGQFRFAHALINQTLYERLGATRRARIHLRVAQALEQLYGEEPGDHLSELALHWRLAAVSVDKAKAADYARRAGQRALESLAPDEAAKLFADAIELSDETDSAARCEALIGLGEAQCQVGNPEFRQTLLDAAELAQELDDPDRLCRAVLANSRGWTRHGALDSERVRALEVAASTLPDDEPRRAQVLALLASELHFALEPERCRALALEAIEIARAAGDRAVLAHTLNSAIWTIWVPDTLTERKRLVDELVELAQSLHDPRLSFWAATRSVMIGLETGDRSRVEPGLAAMRTLAASVPQPSISYMLLVLESGWALVGGELQASEKLAIEAHQVGAASDEPGAWLTFAVHMWHVRYVQGRSRELAEEAGQVADMVGSHSIWRAGDATTLIEVGRPDEAREIALAEDFRKVAMDQSWSGVMFFWANVCSRLRLVDRASELYELLEPFPGLFPAQAGVVHGSIDQALGALAGTLGRYDDAERHFATAAGMDERLGAPLLLARTRARWARGLIARGRPEDLDRAQHMLEQAQGTAGRLGAEGITREVAEHRAALAASNA